MKISEIISEFQLDKEEQVSFKEYKNNKYYNLEEKLSPDEEFIKNWIPICEYAEENSPAEAVNRFVCPLRPVAFKNPGTVKLEIYDSYAGRIPIIYLSEKDDFEQLVTNTVYKGKRPDNISQTGASFAFGKNTRFIMLSSKPYSNVTADELEIDETEWLEKSMILRKYHECTHYFTKQHFGISANSIHDEIMADFIGMYEAFGFYKSEWFLKFMGISERSGNRLIFYTKDLPVNVYKAVSMTAVQASKNLEKWSLTDKFINMKIDDRIRFMCKAGLTEMCTADFI